MQAIKHTLTILAFGLLISSILSDKLFPKEAQEAWSQLIRWHYQQLYEERESEALHLLDKIGSDLSEGTSSHFYYSPEYLSYFVYRHDSLLSWNYNLCRPPTYFSEFYRPVFYQGANGDYIVFVKEIKEMQVVVMLHLSRNYDISNRHLTDKIFPYDFLNDYFFIGQAGGDHSIIYSGSGQRMFSLLPKAGVQSSPFSLILLFLGLLVLILSSKTIRSSIFFWIALIVLSWFLKWPSYIYDLPFFEPALYSGRLLFRNLGDLSLFILLLLLAFRIGRKRIPPSLSPYLAVIMIGMAFVLLSELVFNSTISLKAESLYQLNLASMLAYLMMSALLVIAFRLLLPTLATGSLKQLIAGPILFLAALIFIIILLFHLNEFILIAIPFLLIAILLFRIIEGSRTGSAALFILLLTMGLFLSAELMQERKEKNRLPLLANEIVTARDQIADFLLADVNKRLQNDEYIKGFFSNPFLFKSLIEERIDGIYFSGYLSKYDKQLGLYPSKGRLNHNPNEELRQAVKQLLTAKNYRLEKGLYEIPTRSSRDQYLIVHHYLDRNKDSLGTLYILLNEKVFYEESIYPALLLGGDEQNELEAPYNYAVYYDSNLVSHQGIPNAPLSLTNKDDNSILSISSEMSWVYQPSEHTIVLLSRPVPTLAQRLGSFSLFTSFMMVGFALIYMLLFGIWPRRIWHSEWMSFARKIQVTAIGAVFLAFVILGIATSEYTQNRYEKEAEEGLLLKVQKIAARLQEHLDKNDNADLNTDDFLRIVNQLSDLYETDIDVFNSRGFLAASSQNLLYDNRLLQARLPGERLFRLRRSSNRYFVRSEHIGDLQYLSAYGVVGGRYEAIGFIQLPYFSRQSDLKSELSSFFVSLFDLYVVLAILLAFLIALLTRYLTRPLALLSSQIGKTTLSGEIKPIEWESDDEIGKVIKEYNEMTQKLRISAQQLAEAKREEAWKEMARQVAHEIKNPLTPMKLSVQQLQRAWRDEHPKLNEIFERVTNVIIGQVNSLSRIASEFSSFAKMPDEHKEKISLRSLFDELAALYDLNERQVSFEIIGEDVHMIADRDQLFRACNNLIKNGIQAVPDERSAEIKVKAQTQNYHVVISVADNGTGIDEDRKGMVFKPNFSTKSSGMGLGLAIVKRIVLGHNGEIWFETKANRGTTFYMKIPNS